MKRLKRAVIIVLTAIFAVLSVSALVLLHWDTKTDELDGISLVLTERSVTPSGVDFTVVNGAYGELTYGAWFGLQRRGPFGWEWVSRRSNGAWTLGLRLVPAGTSCVETVNWEHGWGRLPPGTYRLVKEFELNRKGPFRLDLEFKIE